MITSQTWELFYILNIHFNHSTPIHWLSDDHPAEFAPQRLFWFSEGVAKEWSNQNAVFAR